MSGKLLLFFKKKPKTMFLLAMVGTPGFREDPYCNGVLPQLPWSPVAPSLENLTVIRKCVENGYFLSF